MRFAAIGGYRAPARSAGWSTPAAAQYRSLAAGETATVNGPTGVPIPAPANGQG